jgi:hypothetical protein
VEEAMRPLLRPLNTIQPSGSSSDQPWVTTWKKNLQDIFCEAINCRIEMTYSGTRFRFMLPAIGEEAEGTKYVDDKGQVLVAKEKTMVPLRPRVTMSKRTDFVIKGSIEEQEVVKAMVVTTS